MPEVKLSGFGKRSVPMFSYEFYSAEVTAGTTRIVLRKNFSEHVPASEIASWLLESCSGNVICCRYEVAPEENSRSHTRYETTTTTAAIYFESIDDVLMFKMAFHEIIHDFVTKGTPPDGTISIDLDKLKSKLGRKYR